MRDTGVEMHISITHRRGRYTHSVPACRAPLPDLPVTPTHAAVPSVTTRIKTREKLRRNVTVHNAGRIEVTEVSCPPGMWTPLMTDLDCQTGKEIRDTGPGYRCGTGMCTCPRGQSSTVLLGRRFGLPFQSSKFLVVRSLVRNSIRSVPSLWDCR